MEFNGKLTQILTAQQGQSAKGTWQKQDFIIETQDQFPKKICISVWNNKFAPNEYEGCIVNVFADIESREFNGKWYTDIKAWKIEKISGGQIPGKISDENLSSKDHTDMNLEKDNNDISDDLPF